MNNWGSDFKPNLFPQVPESSVKTIPYPSDEDWSSFVKALDAQFRDYKENVTQILKMAPVSQAHVTTVMQMLNM